MTQLSAASVRKFERRRSPARLPACERKPRFQRKNADSALVVLMDNDLYVIGNDLYVIGNDASAIRNELSDVGNRLSVIARANVVINIDDVHDRNAADDIDKPVSVTVNRISFVGIAVVYESFRASHEAPAAIALHLCSHVVQFDQE
jgi:hypothetical protein